MGVLVLGNKHAPYSACTTMTPQDDEDSVRQVHRAFARRCWSRRLIWRPALAVAASVALYATMLISSHHFL